MKSIGLPHLTIVFRTSLRKELTWATEENLLIPHFNRKCGPMTQKHEFANSIQLDPLMCKSKLNGVERDGIIARQGKTQANKDNKIYSAMDLGTHKQTNSNKYEPKDAQALKIVPGSCIILQTASFFVGLNKSRPVGTRATCQQKDSATVLLHAFSVGYVVKTFLLNSVSFNPKGAFSDDLKGMAPKNFFGGFRPRTPALPVRTRASLNFPFGSP